MGMDEQQLMAMMQQGGMEQPMEGEVPQDPSALGIEGGEPGMLEQPEGNPIPDDIEGMPMGEEDMMMEEEMPEEEMMGIPEEEMSFGEFGENPGMPMDDEQMPLKPEVDVQDTLNEVVLQMLDFMLELKGDQTLNLQARSQALSQMSQVVGNLMTHVTDSADQEMKMMEFDLKQEEQQATLEMKAQEHEMNLQFKREELQLKMQEQQLKMQMQQQQMQLKQQQSQQQAANQQQKNAQQLVQSEEKHQQQMKQQEQASQTKQTKKDSSNNG